MLANRDNYSELIKRGENISANTLTLCKCGEMLIALNVRTLMDVESQATKIDILSKYCVKATRLLEVHLPYIGPWFRAKALAISS